MKALFILLLLAVSAHGAQPTPRVTDDIIIARQNWTSGAPHVSPSIPANKAARYWGIGIERTASWSSPTVRASIAIFKSLDGGKTFLPDPICGASGGGMGVGEPMRILCNSSLYQDATHVRATLTVTGGTINAAIYTGRID